MLTGPPATFPGSVASWLGWTLPELRFVLDSKGSARLPTAEELQKEVVSLNAWVADLVAPGSKAY